MWSSRSCPKKSPGDFSRSHGSLVVKTISWISWGAPPKIPSDATIPLNQDKSLPTNFSRIFENFTFILKFFHLFPSAKLLWHFLKSNSLRFSTKTVIPKRVKKINNPFLLQYLSFLKQKKKNTESGVQNYVSSTSTIPISERNYWSSVFFY